MSCGRPGFRVYLREEMEEQLDHHTCSLAPQCNTRYPARNVVTERSHNIAAMDIADPSAATEANESSRADLAQAAEAWGGRD